MTLEDLFSLPQPPEKMRDQLRLESESADRIMLFFIVSQWAIVTMITSQLYGTFLFGFVSGGVVFTAAVIAQRFFGGTRVMGAFMGVAMMMFSVVFIQQYYGLIEMHFSVFLILAFLTLYRDYIPIFAAGAFSLLHHLVFNYLQLYDVTFLGMPIMIFNYGCGMDIVILHGIFVVIEVAILGFIVKTQMQRAIALWKTQDKIGLLNSDLSVLANHDALTGLPNRLNLYSQLEHIITDSHRNRKSFAVLFLDLDHFKNINDSLGHDIGDALLFEVVKRVKPEIRENDVFARLGGDEFIIVLTDISSEIVLSHTIEKIMTLFRAPWSVKGHELVVMASVGVTLYPDDAVEIADLMKQADIAMYRSKELGRNTFSFFTQELNTRVSKAIELERFMGSAMQQGEFELYIQPKWAVESGAIIGGEALIRWNHPRYGVVGPNEFIGIAESTGFIIELGRWIIDEGCRILRQIGDEGFEDVRLSVNISTRQFQHSLVDEHIKESLLRHEVSASRLFVEVTESIMLDQLPATLEKIEAIKDLGAHICLDDFGTGYSSLSYLHSFPIDSIKIDKSFVDQIDPEAKEPILLDSIIAMGQSLNMKVLAEGVEEAYQLEHLKAQGCGYYQGYYGAKPMPLEKFVALLHVKH